MLDRSMDEVLVEARKLGTPIRRLDDRTVYVGSRGEMNKRELEGWIARERVRQALVKVGGI